MLRVNTGSSNHRRYGKPWIAKVSLDDSGQPAFAFGQFIGDPDNGGELAVDVAVGDVVAKGQRDHRSAARKSVTAFFVVHGLSEDGLVQVSKIEAVKHLRARAALADTGPHEQDKATSDDVASDAGDWEVTHKAVYRNQPAKVGCQGLPTVSITVLVEDSVTGTNAAAAHVAKSLNVAHMLSEAIEHCGT